MTKELINVSEIDRQLAELGTVEDANLLRSKIEALEKFIHQVAMDRDTQLAYAHEASEKYSEASVRAGELWNLADRMPHGGDRKSDQAQNFAVDFVTIADAGFKNSQDATICSRVAELHEEDRRIYYEDCLEKNKIPSLHGLYRVWRMMQDNKPLPIAGKYRIIYIDPPWHYGNLMPDYAPMPEVHYEPIRDTDLMMLNIKDIADDNAVMFIWVTSPKLENCFKIIKEWGFQYKASFVWDKVKHNMGHYNSVRHEFLLVCVRGSCPPERRPFPIARPGPSR